MFKRVKVNLKSNKINPKILKRNKKKKRKLRLKRKNKVAQVKKSFLLVNLLPSPLKEIAIVKAQLILMRVKVNLKKNLTKNKPKQKKQKRNWNQNLNRLGIQLGKLKRKSLNPKKMIILNQILILKLSKRELQREEEEISH